MFGLAVLFFLALWVAGTLFAMWLGGRIGAWMGEEAGLPQAGKVLGVAVAFMMAMGQFLLGWTLEKNKLETMVDNLCQKNAGIHIYLSPEEHARRVRDNDWKGVKRAEVKDRDLGSITFGKIVTIDGRKFTASDERIAGKYGDIPYLTEDHKRKYPRHVAYASYLFYDTVHQVPLFRVESFHLTSNSGAGPNFRFWIQDWYGCYLAIDREGRQLLGKYKH